MRESEGVVSSEREESLFWCNARKRTSLSTMIITHLVSRDTVQAKLCKCKCKLAIIMVQAATLKSMVKWLNSITLDEDFQLKCGWLIDGQEKTALSQSELSEGLTREKLATRVGHFLVNAKRSFFAVVANIFMPISVMLVHANTNRKSVARQSMKAYEKVESKVRLDGKSN